MCSGEGTRAPRLNFLAGCAHKGKEEPQGVGVARGQGGEEVRLLLLLFPLISTLPLVAVGQVPQVGLWSLVEETG